MKHPVVKSKRCHACDRHGTDDYRCADCKKVCCNYHMYWSHKTDKKWRCDDCFTAHNKEKKVKYE